LKKLIVNSRFTKKAAAGVASAADFAASLKR